MPHARVEPSTDDTAPALRGGASPPPAPGALLAGKYRVLRVIGEGGMGLVVEAEHALSGKRVAIKWLHPEYAAQPLATERLMREARAAARVRHPNVVDVYDVIEADGSVMLVMELLEGQTLAAALERGEMSVPRFLRLVIGAMRGVADAHRHDVIHRDIKPENIFLARHPDRDVPTPKVLDFGISKLVDGSAVPLTRPGDALGTPIYMSYEQLNGVPDIDARTDVYAFGVLLYEGLTGHAPYAAEAFSELLVQMATAQPVPLQSLRPELPIGLGQAVHRALEKDREQRTPSLEVLANELEPLAAENPSGPQVLLAIPSLRARSRQTAASARARPAAERTLLRDENTWVERRAPRFLPWLAGCALLLAAITWYVLSRRQPSASPQVARPIPARVPVAITAPNASAPQPSSPETAMHEANAVPAAPAPRPATPAASAHPHTTIQLPARSSPKPAHASEAPDLPARPRPKLRAGRPEREDF